MKLEVTTISTARLRLEPLRVDDAEAMVTVLGDEGMYEFTGGRPPSLEQLRDRYEHLAVGRSSDGAELWCNWIVWLPDGTAIGVLQATIEAAGTGAAVAWEVGVAWQGRGLASEAAAAIVGWLVEQGVDDITAHIHPHHAASAGVAARAGLVPTADVVDGERVWRRPAER